MMKAAAMEAQQSHKKVYFTARNGTSTDHVCKTLLYYVVKGQSRLALLSLFIQHMCNIFGCFFWKSKKLVLTCLLLSSFSVTANFIAQLC